MLCDVNIVDIAAMIKLVNEFVVVAVIWPREVVKKLYALFERILESRIWSDSAFVGFISQAYKCDVDPSQINVSGPMFVFGTLLPTVNPDFLLTGSQFERFIVLGLLESVS